jgi:translation machinery-associated protein 16
MLIFSLEIPDLTHDVNVKLFRKWDQKEAGYIQLLRFVRISSSDLETAVLSRPGKHPLLIASNSNSSLPGVQGETASVDDSLLDPTSPLEMMTTD